MMSVLDSDFLFWSALHVARDPMIESVLATPSALLKTASLAEQTRIDAMLDTILPVSARAQGLRSDTAVGKHLMPMQLSSISTPTLIISARDDKYGTYASAEYIASRIVGARFLGFERGGHTWVGHDGDVMAAIARLLVPGYSQNRS